MCRTGAKLPFSMIYLAPLTTHSPERRWETSSGYEHLRPNRSAAPRLQPFAAVAHTAVSGTGIQLALEVRARAAHQPSALPHRAPPIGALLISGAPRVAQVRVSPLCTADGSLVDERARPGKG